MYFAPHKLYKKESQETQFDENGNPIKGSSDSWVYLCDCFLHNVTTAMQKGFAGTGINPTYYINLDRRNDLKETEDVRVLDKEDETLVMGEGEILQIKRTSGMPGNYTVIYI